MITLVTRSSCLISIFSLAIQSIFAQAEQYSGSDSINTDSTISKIYLLHEVAVIGQRSELNTFDRPEAYALLNSRQIRERSPMSMPELLSDIPGVWMQKTNHGGGSPYIRGFTGYQTLIMIDGIRLNNSTFRSGPNQYLNTIDPLNVRRVEVIRGSGSVQYGTDAIGGTMLIMSEDPVFSDNGFKVSGNIYGKLISSGMEKTARAEVNLANKSIAVSGGFSFKNFGNIKPGGNSDKLVPTGYDELASDFKSILRLKENQILTIAFQHLKQNNVPLYHKIISGDYERYDFDPQQRDLGYIRLSSDYSGKIISEIRYTLSYQYSLEGREKKRTGDLQRIREEDMVKTFGGTLEVITGGKNKWNATSGLEYYYDHISSTSETFTSGIAEPTINRGLYPDGSTASNLALFTLHNLDLRKWNVSMGARFNLFRLSLEDEVFGKLKIKPAAIVGNAGVVYKLHPKHHLVFSVNSAFRAPNINDVSSFGIADFRYEVPNYNLVPEKSFTTELGWKSRLDRLSVALYTYRNKLKDLITNVPSSYEGQDSIDGYRVYKRENSLEAVIYGAEAEMEFSLSSLFSAYGNIIYTFGQNISKDEPMRRIPPLNGRFGFRYRDLRGIKVSTEWILVSKQDRLSGGDIADDRIQEGGTPGWNVININLGYSLKFLDIYAGLKNIFNTDYRVHGSGINGIGRCFWISVQLTF